MGYKSNDIALIGEPERLTLSSVPNFITIASKPEADPNLQKTYFEANVTILGKDVGGDPEFKIKLGTGSEYIFTPWDHNENSLAPQEYYISDDPSETAESLRHAMLSVNEVRSNYNITVPSEWVGNTMVNGSTINIKSKSAGMDYSMGFLKYPKRFIRVNFINEISRHGDTVIYFNQSSAPIELDVYVDSNVFMGEDDRGTSPEKIGTYLTTLSKTYACRPIWFDLNKLLSQNVAYSCPCGKSEWFDAGTLRTFKFFLRVCSVPIRTIYESNALYVLNGYGALTERDDLQEYVYSEDKGKVRLLTNQPRIRYVRGQNGYLNFLFSDPNHSHGSHVEYRLDVIYLAYSNSGEYMGGLYDHGRDRRFLTMANTCRLNIDRVLETYPTAGIVKVGLVRGEATVSNMLEFEVVPEMLHTLCPFTFLNRLGGWDSYNFDATVNGEFKIKTETYSKVVTPAFKKGDSMESVYSRNLEETFTVEGSPVNKEVRDWLYELAASKAVYDGDGNYVVVDDLSFDPVQGSDLYRPVMKYHLSEERYNND